MQKINAAGKQRCTNCTPCSFTFKGLPKCIFRLISLVKGKYLPYFILLGSRELSRRVFALKNLSFWVLFIRLYFHISRSTRQLLVSEILVRLISDAWCGKLVSSWAMLQVTNRSLSAWIATCTTSTSNKNSNSWQLCSVTELQ